MNEVRYETDVLCIGGGIAGLMAAIRAAELGIRVMLVEKANTLHSGSGASGNDHIRCYIPEYHGPNIQPIVDEVAHSQVGNGRSIASVRKWMEQSFDIVKLWDSWGIPMKYNGKWEFAGHGFPGKPLTTLKYSGKEQKKVLTREAVKRGVKIVNRVMVFDLLRDKEGITGAIGVDTRVNEINTFHAKSVILTTGNCVRLYPSITPGWTFNRAYCPSTTGDGRAMAYRAGAELFNIEIPQRWAGPKYFSRCGKATWVGVIRDPEGKPVGPFVTKPDKKYGDAISDVYHTLFEDYTRAGKGPLYMDCRGITDEDLAYMFYWLENEGDMALVNHLKEEGIDLTKNPVEFTTYEMTTSGGIKSNDKCETSVKGLYAAGDEYFGGISAAANFGWLAGESAAEFAKIARNPDLETGKALVEKKKELLSELGNRQDGSSWQEANMALGQIMADYAGATRSDTMLEAGLSYLKRLKAHTFSTLTARNQHEIMHCLEVFNLLDIGLLVFTASLERKESRGGFKRTDYPFTNPLLNNKTLICRMADDKPVLEWG